MARALLKLDGGVTGLPQPHAKKLRGYPGLWELRPQQGSNPWRAFYRRVGMEWVIGSVGPDAKVDLPGFNRSCSAALARIDAYERDQRRLETNR